MDEESMSSKHSETNQIQKRKATFTLRPRKRRFQTYKRVSLGNWVDTNITLFFIFIPLTPPHPTPLRVSIFSGQSFVIEYYKPHKKLGAPFSCVEPLLLFGHACFLPFAKGLILAVCVVCVLLLQFSVFYKMLKRVLWG